MAFCTPPLRRGSLCEPRVSGSTSDDAGRSLPTVLLTLPRKQAGTGIGFQVQFPFSSSEETFIPSELIY